MEVLAGRKLAQSHTARTVTNLFSKEIRVAYSIGVGDSLNKEFLELTSM